jgi:hypothetical protein
MISGVKLRELMSWASTRSGTYSSGRHIDKRFLAPEASDRRESTATVKYKRGANKKREGIALLRYQRAMGTEINARAVAVTKRKGKGKNRWRDEWVEEGLKGMVGRKMRGQALLEQFHARATQC